MILLSFNANLSGWMFEGVNTDEVSNRPYYTNGIVVCCAVDLF